MINLKVMIQFILFKIVISIIRDCIDIIEKKTADSST